MLLIYLIIFGTSILYLWIEYVYSYWERRGMPFLKPSIPFGNLKNVWNGTKSIGIELFDLHKSSKNAIDGIYFVFRPALLVRDPSLIKKILATDFASFHDRGFYYDPKRNPIGSDMFMTPGQEWKSIRTKLTPTFTSGKLKGMMPIIIQIAENLKNKLTSAAQNTEIVNIKEHSVR